ncbi:MAG: septum formation initiator family protein [Candidatus Uhrbacteria bacterium]
MPAPKKSFIRRILELRMFLLVNLLILFFLSLSFGREFLRDYQIQREINNLRADAESLEARNFEIIDFNTELQTQAYLEEEARLRLGLGDPGENLVIIINDDGEQVIGSEVNSEQLITHNSQLTTLKASNPQRWYYYFFDHEQFINLKVYGE